MSFPPWNWKTFIRLHPNISMYILHTEHFLERWQGKFV